MDEPARRIGPRHDWVVEFNRAKPLNPSKRVALFKSLRLAREQPAGEPSSPLGLRLLSQGLAVGTAMITGERGGLPAAIRLPLAVLRGLTLAVSNFIGVLTRSPPFGIAWLVLTSVLIVWALVAPNTLLDAVLPALLAILVAGAWALLAMLTNRLQVPIRGWRGWMEAVGVLVLLVAPPLVIAYFFLGIPGLAPQSSRVMDWVCGDARSASVCADLLKWGGLVAVVAAVLALLALVLQAFRGRVHASRRWQRRMFFLYRVAIFATAGLVAAAATYDRWSDIEDRRGLLLFVLLAGALTVMTAVASAWERLRGRDFWPCDILGRSSSRGRETGGREWTRSSIPAKIREHQEWQERFCPPTAVERWLEDAAPMGQTTSPADAGGSERLTEQNVFVPPRGCAECQGAAPASCQGSPRLGSPLQIAETLGHSDTTGRPDPTLVWKRYGHLYPGSTREAIAALDRHLGTLAG